ncbi:MAG: polysaccharide deacetylase family protein [Verrucomicrobiota bacterium]
MKTLSLSLFLYTLIAFGTSFANPPSLPNPLPSEKGGIVLTFDDRNFDDWLAALPLFEQYKIKATFFISGPVDQKALDAALELKKHGHAIGCHSIRHLAAVKYAAQFSAEQYVQKEVLPQLTAFKAAGIHPTAFAYPMSNNNESTDAALLKIFRHVRTGAGISSGERISDKKVFFVPVSNIGKHHILIGKGVDYAPTKILTFQQIDDALTRAAKNKEIIVLYAHRIASSGKGHRISPTALKHIFNSAKKLQLPFYTVDQLP